MATKEETARYGWIRSAGFGALALVLAFMALNGGHAPTGMLVGILGVGLVIYSLIKRDRDRRALSEAATPRDA